jgi:aldose 1-epimerase
MRARTYAADQIHENGIPIVRLTDDAHGIQVSLVPSIGNRAYEMLVRGENILHSPLDSPAALKGNKHLSGIPFLAPWANRMPGGFHANGKHYQFNAGLDSVRLDQNGISIHGLLSSSPFWEVVDAGANEDAAYVTSRLEFWRHPDLMANWPFAQDYEMTYRLAGGVLEVSVTIANRSADPMPVAVGFHPYFQLPGVPVEEAVASIPVRRHVETDSGLVATGQTTPVAFIERVSLKDHRFDDGFTDLVRGTDGRTVFAVEGRGKKIEVIFGPRYQVAVIYAPPGENFICFEPMSTITNGINLASEGKYPELQTVGAGSQWRESFWIRPEGF